VLRVARSQSKTKDIHTMAKEYAKAFYNSKSWQTTREAYFNSQFGLCEKCGRVGEEVHHKKPITPFNLNDPNIALNWENLQLLCRSCHELAHAGTQPTTDGITFDSYGQVLQIDNVGGVRYDD